MLLKFDGVAQAKAWYESPDYCRLRETRGTRRNGRS
ncbi:MAG: DUF1330 domain-containing protein [Betaproteobacteria bacterium]|nr:DUF1330 domain-containing protein [Betaproteobacteria bacterium]